MEHVQSKLNRQAEIADIITSQKIGGSAAGPSWTRGLFQCLSADFYFYIFLGVAVDVA